MSHLKDDKKLSSSHQPDLISIFMLFAARLPDTLNTNEAKIIRGCRNRLAHDPLFTIDPNALDELLRLTKHYVDKDWLAQFTIHTGIDVGNRLASTEAHDRGHSTMRWKPEARPTAQPRPPAFAEFLLRQLLCKTDVDAVIGDLTEMYNQRLAKYGKRRARLWFYGQVWLSILPLLKRAISTKWLRRLIP